jgi:hypothetical protein
MLAGLAAGCAGGSDEPALVPVEGTVSFNDKPLEGATISFVPDEANAASTPGADLTGPDGSFKAMHRNRPGLAPGKYKVLVTKSGSDSKKPIPEALQKDSYMTKLAGLDKEEAPSLYADLKKTPLTLDVSAQGEKGIHFPIKGTLK